MVARQRRVGASIGQVLAVLLLGVGALSACGLPDGGTPPPANCDGDTAGGPDGNSTVATARGVTFGSVTICNDQTDGPSDLDLLKLPIPTGVGRLTITCPTSGLDGTVELLDSTGTDLTLGYCLADPGVAIDIGIATAQYYVSFDHSDQSDEGALSIAFTALTGETDPQPVTLPGTVAGTVGPDDPTDTITFTDPAGFLRWTAQCAVTIPLSISGLSSGFPSTFNTLFGCDAAHSLGGTTYFDDGQPDQITVSAPPGATGPIAYVISVSGQP